MFSFWKPEPILNCTKLWQYFALANEKKQKSCVYQMLTRPLVAISWNCRTLPQRQWTQLRINSLLNIFIHSFIYLFPRKTKNKYLKNDLPNFIPDIWHITDKCDFIKSYLFSSSHLIIGTGGGKKSEEQNITAVLDCVFLYLTGPAPNT